MFLDVWNVEEAARLIETERVTFTMGATPFLQDLTYASTTRDLSSLRLFISAGASIPRQLVKDARARLRLRDLGGLGHDGERARDVQRPRPIRRKRSSAPTASRSPAWPCASSTTPSTTSPRAAKAISSSSGPAQFVGYWKRPEFTREGHTADGWFKTGDRATLDRDGYVSITGRSKDVIIRGGENIPVAEVENALFTHPRSRASPSSPCPIRGCRSGPAPS